MLILIIGGYHDGMLIQVDKDIPKIILEETLPQQTIQVIGREKPIIVKQHNYYRSNVYSPNEDGSHDVHVLFRHETIEEKDILPMLIHGYRRPPNDNT